MAKTNIRSFRYSDEVAGILEGFKGASLNDKFENLVLHCFLERERIERRIATSKDDLSRLNERIDEKRQQLYDLDSLLRDRQKISREITQLSMLIVDYTGKLQKDVTQMTAAAPGDLEQKSVTASVNG